MKNFLISFLFFGSLCFAGVSDSAVIIQDEFTEGSNTPLASHTPTTTGDHWKADDDTPSYGIQVLATTDVLAPAGTTANDGALFTVHVDAGESPYSSADYTVEGDFSTSAPTDADDLFGIVARFQDLNNYYVLISDGDVGNLILKKVVAGSWTTLDSTTITFTDNDTFKLETIGTTISGYQNNILRVSVTDNAISLSGVAGVVFGSRASGTSTDDVRFRSQIDNFIVTTDETVTSGDVYVNASCGSSGNGTTSVCGPSGPYKTLQEAHDNASCGDIVSVAVGTYNTLGANSAILHIDKNCSPGKRLTFISATHRGAVIDAGEGTYNYAIFIRGTADYVTIGAKNNGFKIIGGASSGIFIRTDPGQGQGGGGYFEILGNEIYNNGWIEIWDNIDRCTNDIFGKNGVYDESHDTLIKWNDIHDNGRLTCTVDNGGSGQTHDQGVYMEGYNTTVIENRIYDNASMGVKQTFWGDSALANRELDRNPTITNNVIFGNLWGSGIHLWEKGNTTTANGIVRDNIIMNNGLSGSTRAWVGHAINIITPSGMDWTSLLVQNNIMFGNYRQNDVYDGYFSGEDNLSTGVSQTGTIIQDPLFISESSPYDFHLQSGSPAISAGFSGGDIGAYPEGTSGIYSNTLILTETLTKVVITGAMDQLSALESFGTTESLGQSSSITLSEAVTFGEVSAYSANADKGSIFRFNYKFGGNPN